MRSIPRRKSRAAAISAIAGYDDVVGGKAAELSGIATPDDKTVMIKLSRPDATFLHVMAINFAYVIPKEEVEKAGADWGKKPVGTGAFKFVEWVPGQRIVLERNKDYFKAGVPYLDKLTFEFGHDPTVAVLKLKNGEIDIVGDGIPPAQFAEAMADPANKDLIAKGDQLHTGYVTMNVTHAALRQCEGAPGHQHGDQQGPHRQDSSTTARCRRPRPCRRPCPATMPTTRATPMIRKAPRSFSPKRASGEISTELYVMNVDPNPRIAQAIQQDLAAVGIKAEINSLAQAEVIAAGGAGKAPMIWSGGMAWIADFPDPNNFYYGILGCAGAVEGGWNWSKYCNKALDDRATADAMVKDDQKDDAHRQWKASSTMS